MHIVDVKMDYLDQAANETLKMMKPNGFWNLGRILNGGGTCRGMEAAEGSFVCHPWVLKENSKHSYSWGIVSSRIQSVKLHIQPLHLTKAQRGNQFVLDNTVSSKQMQEWILYGKDWQQCKERGGWTSAWDAAECRIQHQVCFIHRQGPVLFPMLLPLCFSQQVWLLLWTQATLHSLHLISQSPSHHPASFALWI